MILIVIGLFEIYVDIFVRDDFISTKVQYIWAGIGWAFIGYIIKDFNRFPLLEIATSILIIGIFLHLANSYELLGGFILILLLVGPYLFKRFPLFSFQAQTGPASVQNGFQFSPENIFSIVGPVLLLLTLFLPWSIGTSQGDIIDIETQVEVTFTGSQLFQINSLVMFVVIASVVPIIQYAVKKNEEFPMIPTVCFGIVALCDLLLFNDIRGSSVDFDLGEAGSITGNASPGIGLILNLILSALLAFFSFQSQTESGSVQNEASYEEKQESRVPKKVVKEKSTSSLVKELKKLNELKEQGILDDDEFKAAKAKLLK